MKPTAHNLGNRIGDLNRAAGWDQQRLAQETGLTVRQVAHVMNGTRIVDRRTYEQIRDALRRAGANQEQLLNLDRLYRRYERLQRAESRKQAQNQHGLFPSKGAERYEEVIRMVASHPDVSPAQVAAACNVKRWLPALAVTVIRYCKTPGRNPQNMQERTIEAFIEDQRQTSEQLAVRVNRPQSSVSGIYQVLTAIARVRPDLLQQITAHAPGESAPATTDSLEDLHNNARLGWAQIEAAIATLEELNAELQATVQEMKATDQTKDSVIRDLETRLAQAEKRAAVQQEINEVLVAKGFSLGRADEPVTAAHG